METPEDRAKEIERLQDALTPVAWAALRVQAGKHLGRPDDNGLSAMSLMGTAAAREALERLELRVRDARLDRQGSAAEAALLEILAEWTARGILRPRHMMHDDAWQNPYYVTSYGFTCVQSEDPDNVPDDPLGYLAAIEARTGPLDATLRAFLVESLSCFRGKTYRAALVMLGCASEHLLSMLNAALPAKINESKPGKLVPKLIPAIERELVSSGAKLGATDEEHWKGRLQDGLNLIRASRNEAGHPKLAREVDRFHVRERFLLFSGCVESAYAVLRAL